MKANGFTIWNFVFIFVIVESQLTTKDYADLISDIYNYTQSSSVALIHFTKEGNLNQKNLIFQMQILLFRKNITVSDINLRIISNLTDQRFHNFKGLKKDNCAISVYFLACINDFNEMIKYTKLIIRTKIVNFVIFTEHKGTTYSNICREAKNNQFGLSRGVSILVKCWTNGTIQEWHAINETAIKIIPRATWEPKRSPRFIPMSGKLLIGNREAIEGKVLRAAIIKESSTIGNYFPNLRTALEEAGDFRFDVVREVGDEYGIYYEANKSWSGAVGLIVDNQVDIALGWFTYLPIGFSVVDYTVTIDRAEFVILIKKPESRVLVSWTGYFQPFTLAVWLALLFLFITIQVICAFLKNILNFHHEAYTADDFFYISGIFLHQDLPSIPRETPLRIFYISVIIFSFYIWSIYSATFVSKLTVIDTNLPFKSLGEFTQVKSHKMIVFQDTSNYYKLKNATRTPLKEARELLVNDDQLPKTNEEAIKMICNEGMALFTDDMFLAIAYDNSIADICPMVTIRTNEFDSFAMILAKNSPYTSAINHFLRSFLNNGVMSRLKCQLSESIPNYSKNESDNKGKAVHIIDIVILITILIASAFASFVILFFEIWYFNSRAMKDAKMFQATKLRQIQKNRDYPSRIF